MLFIDKSSSFNGFVNADELAPILWNMAATSIDLSGDIRSSARSKVSVMSIPNAWELAAILASPSTPFWNPNLFNFPKFSTTKADTAFALTPMLLEISLTNNISLPISFIDLPASINPFSSFSIATPDILFAANSSFDCSLLRITFLPKTSNVLVWTSAASFWVPPNLIISSAAPAYSLLISSASPLPCPIWLTKDCITLSTLVIPFDKFSVKSVTDVVIPSTILAPLI